MKSQKEASTIPICNAMPTILVMAILLQVTSLAEGQVRQAEDKQALLPAKTQDAVDLAVKNGIVFLRGAQTDHGYFGNAVGFQTEKKTWAVGFAALPGLALLESGVPPGDAAIQKAARFVRQQIPNLNRTYEISLAILFLDRLGAAKDRDLIHSLALRLAAGQTSLGGWGYYCPVLSAAQEKKLLERLTKLTPEPNAKPLKLPSSSGANESADNSNTQFAILGLWTSRKYELPLDYTLAKVEHRFRSGQGLAGWDYRLVLELRNRGIGYGSMTCAGLLALAVGRGSSPHGGKVEKLGADAKPEDPGMVFGLRSLTRYLDDPTDTRSAARASSLGPKNALNYYFLWSVERVGVLLNLKTIGGKDWYRWGVDLILPEQKKDGSWVGRGSGGSPVIDTCFALLFLKKSDLLPDLRETLQKRLKIVDPGESSKSPSDKSENPPKSPDSSPKKKASPAPSGAKSVEEVVSACTCSVVDVVNVGDENTLDSVTMNRVRLPGGPGTINLHPPDLLNRARLGCSRRVENDRIRSNQSAIA